MDLLEVELFIEYVWENWDDVNVNIIGDIRDVVDVVFSVLDLGDVCVVEKCGVDWYVN